MIKTKQSKPVNGWIIIVGLVSTICGACFMVSIFQDIFAPAPPSASAILDTNAITTHIFETAAADLTTLNTATFTSTVTAESTSTILPTFTDTPAPVGIPVTGGSCIPDNPPQTGRVVQVVDGDTIKVILDEDGLTYSIRYIGMDTPENTSQVECFGSEATAKNTELVYGKVVTLIKDVSETDQYGRLLRYVLVDEIFVNYELVAQGYANTASYPPDISCIPTFQAAEGQASVSKFGFWGAPPTLAIVIPTAVSSGGGSGGDAPCNCSGPDLDCGDLGSHTSAQACFNYCVSQNYGDVFRLDRDSDGLACEG